LRLVGPRTVALIDMTNRKDLRDRCPRVEPRQN